MEPSTLLVLPNSIVSPIDVARLLRELDAIESFFQQQAVRKAGEPNTMPRLSHLLDELAAQNKLNLLQPTDRAKIMTFLKTLSTHAPVMHVSFSSDPPGQYVQKIVAHIRKNIHEQVLVTVGLQPNIGAGCIVRTTNKIFDLSLREYFKQKKGVFLDRLHHVVAAEPELATNQDSAQSSPEAATQQAEKVGTESTAQPASQTTGVAS